jgi:hypothetical protein
MSRNAEFAAGRWRGTALAVGVCLLAATSRAANAGPVTYDYSLIADSKAPVFADFSTPSVGDNGTVGFYVYLEGGGKAMYRGTTAGTTLVATQGSVALQTRTAVDAAGRVIYSYSSPGSIWRGSSTADAALIVDGVLPSQFNGVFSAVATAGNGPIYFTGGRRIAAGGGSGVFSKAADGTIATLSLSTGPLHGTPFSVAANDAGDIVFRAQRDAGGQGLYSIVNGVLTELVAEATSQFFLLGSPNIDDNGVITFFSYLDGGGLGNGMYRIENGVLSTIADSTGPFAFFGGPTAVNDDEIAFFATMDAGWTGIFTGGDPVNDLVIRTGDTLFGRTVSQLDLWENGLNESGQLAFRAGFTDGSSAIVLATPPAPAAVPEPGSLTILILALAALPLLQRTATSRTSSSSARRGLGGR